MPSSKPAVQQACLPANPCPQAFIDEEILVILGQMDPASRVFDFLYLGRSTLAKHLFFRSSFLPNNLPVSPNLQRVERLQLGGAQQQWDHAHPQCDKVGFVFYLFAFVVHHFNSTFLQGDRQLFPCRVQIPQYPGVGRRGNGFAQVSFQTMSSGQLHNIF